MLSGERRARGPPLGLCPPGHQVSPPVGAAALGGPRETDRPHNWGRSPHPSRLRRATFPLGGGRLFAPVALARQTQAQLWNRTRYNFPQPQGPVARREFRHSLRFCAPEGICLLQGVTPVFGVRGKRPMDLGGTKWSRSPSDASPGAFCLLFRHGKRRSPPGFGCVRRKTYLWRRNWERFEPARRVVAPYRKTIRNLSSHTLGTFPQGKACGRPHWWSPPPRRGSFSKSQRKGADQP